MDTVDGIVQIVHVKYVIVPNTKRLTVLALVVLSVVNMGMVMAVAAKKRLSGWAYYRRMTYLATSTLSRSTSWARVKHVITAKLKCGVRNALVEKKTIIDVVTVEKWSYPHWQHLTKNCFPYLPRIPSKRRRFVSTFDHSIIIFPLRLLPHKLRRQLQEEVHLPTKFVYVTHADILNVCLQPHAVCTITLTG
jgi:hypothetical protein